MKKIIVNADDFGYSFVINSAILLAFKLGLITSSTIITNLSGFDDAVNIIKNNGLHGEIGIHFNLSEGLPLSQKIMKCSRLVDEHGYLNFQRNPSIRLTKQEKWAIFDELEMQLLKLIDSGIHPIRIDSHYHVHTEWSIGSLVIKIAKKYNIHSIRLSRNTGVGITFAKKIYKYLYNTRLKRYGFRVTDYFGDYVDLMRKKLTSDVELMVHPLLKDDVLVDLDGTKLELVIEKILNDF